MSLRKLAAEQWAIQTGSKSSPTTPQESDEESASNRTSFESAFSHSFDEEWQLQLFNAIENLQDRKFAKLIGQPGREDSLAIIAKIMALNVTKSVLENDSFQLTLMSAQACKAGASLLQVVNACKVLSMCLLTFPEMENIWETVVPTLRLCFKEHKMIAAKLAVAEALSTIQLVFNNDNEQESKEILEFINNEIRGSVEQRSHQVDVVHMINCVGVFLTTLNFKDNSSREENQSDILVTSYEIIGDALEDFTRMLKSKSSEIRIAAGECIALIYEIARSISLKGFGEDDALNNGVWKLHKESNSMAQDASSSLKEQKLPGLNLSSLKKRYNYIKSPQECHDMMETIKILSTTSSKQQAKKGRKIEKLVFRRVLASLHDPTYTTKISFPSLKFGQNVCLSIDSWKKYFRMQHLKRVVSYGLHVQFVRCETVRRILEYIGPIPIFTKAELGITPPKVRSKENTDANTLKSSSKLRRNIRHQESKHVQKDNIKAGRKGKLLSQQYDD